MNKHLQPVQTIVLDKEQARFPIETLVYLILMRWRPILVSAPELYALLRVKYHYQWVKATVIGGAGQVYFYTGCEVKFKKGSWAEHNTLRILLRAEEDGSMNTL
ncbi:hypothetical protein EDD85DRAFT_798859 [Armillaria nabsnona]|nr:hypothetical protein EDD85DRAFT_798859 [Armillaria nabsnona]